MALSPSICLQPVSTPETRRPRRGQASCGSIQERNRRVERYRAVVKPLAIHYARCSRESVEDLLQVGLMGLIRAAELYSADRQTPFEAFARPHIRGAILHYLRDAAPLVRLPRRQAELQERFNRLRNHPAVLAGGAEGIAALCRTLGVSREEWQRLEMQRQLARPAHLDDPTVADVLATSAATVVSDVSARPCPAPETSPVAAMLALLEPRQGLVVRQVVLDGWSYRRLGRQMAVSPMTVKRLLHKGLEQLRQQLDAQGFRPGDLSDPGASVAPGC